MRFNTAEIDTQFIVDLITTESKFKNQLANLFKAEVKKQAFMLVNAQKNKYTEGSKLKYIKDVLELVCDCLNVTVEQLKSTKRDREFVEARQIFAYLIMRASTYKVSLGLAGSFINKDHATVLYSAKSAEKLIEWNKNFQIKYTECLKLYKTKHQVKNEFINEYNYIPQL